MALFGTRFFVSIVRKIVGRKETKTSTSLPTIKRAPTVSVHVAKKTPSGSIQQVGTYIRSSGGSVTQVSGITQRQAQQVESRGQIQEKARQTSIRKKQIFRKELPRRTRPQISREAHVRRARKEYIEEREVRTFMRKGKEIPITDTFIVDSQGNIIRKATPSESTQLRREKQALRIPELPKDRGQAGLILIDRERERLQTERRRGKKPSIERELKLAGLVIASSLLATKVAIEQLPRTAPQFVANLIKDPKSIKKVPQAIKSGGARFGQLLRVSPTEAIALVGTEVLILKGTGKALKVVGGVSSRTATRLSPKFSGVKKQVINIPSKQAGKTINIEIGGTVKKLAEPLRKQVQLAGKEVTGVSAQADRLLRLVRRTKIVRKPIPGEEGLSKITKNLLRKFDNKKIGKKDLIKLDQRIRKETKGAGNLLERSFFADPRGRLRPSRLGIRQKEASLSDILSGDVTFKTQRPQVLIFEKVKVEKFPKALKGLEKKLKAGKPLTRNEANRLLQFQLKKSGKFKPIGHLTREPEISIAPGEIIKKGKTMAVTIIEGKRVPIISAKVIKAKPETARLLKKAKTGKLTTIELKKLRSNLQKETGFKTSFSRGRIGKPRARRPKPLPRRRPKPRRRPARRRPTRRRPAPRRPPPRRPPPRRPPPRRPARRRPTRRRPAPRRPPPRRPPPRRPPPRRPPPRRPPPRRPPPRIVPRPPPKIIPRRVKRKRRIKKKPKRPRSFEVWARPLKKTKKGKKPQLIKVSKVPLSKRRAEDLRDYIVDHSLGRTARIKPTKGKPTTPKLKVPISYSRKTSTKFRRYRIVKGKKVPLIKGRVIERRRHLLDTRSEKKAITLKRKIAQMSRPPKRRPATKRKTIKRKKSSKRSGGIFNDF